MQAWRSRLRKCCRKIWQHWRIMWKAWIRRTRDYESHQIIHTRFNSLENLCSSTILKTRCVHSIGLFKWDMRGSQNAKCTLRKPSVRSGRTSLNSWPDFEGGGRCALPWDRFAPPLKSHALPLGGSFNDRSKWKFGIFWLLRVYTT